MHLLRSQPYHGYAKNGAEAADAHYKDVQRKNEAFWSTCTQEFFSSCCPKQCGPHKTDTYENTEAERIIDIQSGQTGSDSMTTDESKQTLGTDVFENISCTELWATWTQEIFWRCIKQCRCGQIKTYTQAEEGLKIGLEEALGGQPEQNVHIPGSNDITSEELKTASGTSKSMSDENVYPDYPSQTSEACTGEQTDDYEPYNQVGSYQLFNIADIEDTKGTGRFYKTSYASEEERSRRRMVHIKRRLAAIPLAAHGTFSPSSSKPSQTKETPAVNSKVSATEELSLPGHKVSPPQVETGSFLLVLGGVGTAIVCVGCMVQRYFKMEKSAEHDRDNQ